MIDQDERGDHDDERVADAVQHALRTVGPSEGAIEAAGQASLSTA